VIKLISYIVLTHFFHFNELKILRQPGNFYNQKVKPIFVQCSSGQLTILWAHLKWGLDMPCKAFKGDLKAQLTEKGNKHNSDTAHRNI